MTCPSCLSPVSSLRVLTLSGSNGSEERVMCEGCERKTEAEGLYRVVESRPYHVPPLEGQKGLSL